MTGQRLALGILLLVILSPAAAAADGALVDRDHHVAPPTADARAEVGVVAPGTDGSASVGGDVHADPGAVAVEPPRCDRGGSCDPGGLDVEPAAVGLDPWARIPVPDLLSPSAGDDRPVRTAGQAPAPADGVHVGLLQAALVLGGSAVTLALLLRVLGSAGGAVVPMASRLADDELLEDPTRSAIMDLVRRRPGVSTKDIAQELDLAWGTLTHHLRKLQESRHLVSEKYGKYRRHFANGAATDPDLRALLATLRHPRTAEVVDVIRHRPGISQTGISDEVGVSSSTVLWHVKRLLEVDAVEKRRDGRRVTYRLAGSFGDRLAKVPGDVPADA